MDTGTILSSLALALAAFLLLPTRRLPAWGRGLGLAALVLLGMVPLQGLPLATYPVSLTGDLAVTTMIWLAWSAGARVLGAAPLPAEEHRLLAAGFAILALGLYPATLGLTDFDPYRLGYAPRLLLLPVLLFSLWLWWKRHYFGAALFTAATVAYLLGLKPSGNYWDYLLDPLLGGYGLLYLGGQAVSRCRRRGKSVPAPELATASSSWQAPEAQKS